MSDLSNLIEQRLVGKGEAGEARAFRRLMGNTLNIEVSQHTVREAKDDFSGFLRRMHGKIAMTIAPRRRLEGAVVVISLEQLADTLGALAAEVEQSPGSGLHNPMAMFAAIDRLPEVDAASAVLADMPRRPDTDLNLD